MPFSAEPPQALRASAQATWDVATIAALVDRMKDPELGRAVRRLDEAVEFAKF